MQVGHSSVPVDLQWNINNFQDVHENLRSVYLNELI